MSWEGSERIHCLNEKDTMAVWTAPDRCGTRPGTLLRSQNAAPLPRGLDWAPRASLSIGCAKLFFSSMSFLIETTPTGLPALPMRMRLVLFGRARHVACSRWRVPLSFRSRFTTRPPPPWLRRDESFFPPPPPPPPPLFSVRAA